jgi:hypothetical protein
MENEKESKLNEINIVESKNVFKLDYNGQSLKGNKNFIDWENNMKKELGSNAKLFKCIYDNIYYFVSDVECKTIPYYKAKCPLCNRSICYFCSRYTKDNFDQGKCCMTRRTYCMLFQDIYAVVHPKFKSDGNYSWQLKIYFFPIISFMYFVAFFSIVYFYKLSVKNSKSDDGYLGIYENAIKNSHRRFFTIIGFNVAFAFCLSIPFTIFGTYFKILFLLISFPFKFYPLKLFFGIMLEGLRGSL